MKKSILPLIIAAAALFSCLPASGQQKIAVIDLEKIIRLHDNTKADRAFLEDMLEKSSVEKDKLQADVLAARKAFEEAARNAVNPALNEKARNAAEALAKEKRQTALDAEKKATERIRELQRNLNEEEIKRLKVTTEAVERAIKAYCKANGIDLVLQLPSPKLGAVSSVLFAKQELDITEDIMKVIGIEVPAEDEAPAEDAEEAGAPAGAGEKAGAPAEPAK